MSTLASKVGYSGLCFTNYRVGGEKISGVDRILSLLYQRLCMLTIV